MTKPNWDEDTVVAAWYLACGIGCGLLVPWMLDTRRGRIHAGMMFGLYLAYAIPAALRRQNERSTRDYREVEEAPAR